MPSGNRRGPPVSLTLKMEGNRDESERCLHRSETFLKIGDLEKALKFANKAARLYPSEKAEGRKKNQLRSHFLSVLL